jgi:hypothetical protein
VNWQGVPGVQPLLPFDVITRAHAEQDTKALLKGIVAYQAERHGVPPITNFAWDQFGDTSAWRERKRQVQFGYGSEHPHLLKHYGMPLLPERIKIGESAYFAAHEAGHAGDKRLRQLRKESNSADNLLSLAYDRRDRAETRMWELEDEERMMLYREEEGSPKHKKLVKQYQKASGDFVKANSAYEKAKARQLRIDTRLYEYIERYGERFADRSALQGLRHLNLPGLTPADIQLRPGSAAYAINPPPGPGSEAYRHRRRQLEGFARMEGMSHMVGDPRMPLGLTRIQEKQRLEKIARQALKPKLRGRAAGAQMLLDFLLD